MRTATLALLGFASCAGGPVLAQPAVSAKPGVVSYVHGDVVVDEQRVTVEKSRPLSLATGAKMRTAPGARAELMLNPCVVLHLDQNSELRVVNMELPDASVELLSGAAIVRADGILRDTRVAVTVGSIPVAMANRGLYRFDAAPPRLRVFEGKAVVPAAPGPLTLRSGRMALLDSGSSPRKFDPDQRADAFGRWSEARAIALLLESGYNERAEREHAQRLAAWRRAEAGGRLPAGSLPPPSNPATRGRLALCADGGRTP